MAIMLLTAGCPKLPQGNTRSESGSADRKETPTPTTAPHSRAEQAGGTANRPENFGDISNSNSPVRDPGAEKKEPAGGRPAAKPETK